MCSLQEHIEREARARQAEQETADVEDTIIKDCARGCIGQD